MSSPEFQWKFANFYDFLGFETHVRQIRERRGVPIPQRWYERPAYYLGSIAPDKIFGSGKILIPHFIRQPDYECEFALMVGHYGKPTSMESAVDFIKQHCFFTLLNDWSARDYQKWDMEMGMSVAHSKSIIGTSIGPKLAAAKIFDFDNNGNPDIPVTLTVNGECRTETNANTAYWGFAKILAFLGNENISVFPGDLLGSGTVGNGSIAEIEKVPWLKEGDEVVIASEKIGRLCNQVKVI